MRESLRTHITNDKAEIFYRVIRGDTPRRVIVLLHGMASNMTRWAEFVEQTALKETWDLLRLDLRGHGHSPYRGRVGMDVWCADIDAILEAEGYRQAVLMGHCLGANIAVQFADRYPHKTAGLVLVEPMPHTALTGSLKRFRPLRAFVLIAIPIIRLLNGLGLYRRQFLRLDLRELDRQTRIAMSDQGSDEAMLKRYAVPWHDLRLLPSAVYLQEFLEVIRPLPPLSIITVPVLALLSSGRMLSDPLITQEALSALPNCTIMVLDAHHWIPTEKPEAMRQAVETWTRNLEEAR